VQQPEVGPSLLILTLLQLSNMSPSGYSTRRATILCLFQSLAGLLFGWEQSSGSGLFNMQQYSRRFGTCDDSGFCSMPTNRQSLITGILSIGAFIGALSAGPISGRIGLRTTCLIFIFSFMMGIAIECSAFQTYGQICVGRLFTGLGIGATSGLVPVFQAEAAPPKYRGLITGSFQLCITLGILFVNCANYGMSTHAGDIAFRLPIGIQLVWSAALFVGFLLSPESPKFLAYKGRWDEARKNLCILRGVKKDEGEAGGLIDAEMEDIRYAKEQDDKRGEAKYSECFSMKDRILWRTMIGVLIQIAQQVTGINFFFSYGIQFANAAGIDNTYVYQIILSSVNVVMSFPGLLAVDRLGRRDVLLWGAVIMFSGQIITGALSTARPDQEAAGKALIAFSCLFIAGFASSFGPLAWVVAAEVFPTRLANKCVTLAIAGNWGMNTIIAFVSPIVQEKIGTKITFVWAGFIAASFVFIFFCVPETKGLAIDEIDALFLSGTPAWRSKQFRRSQEAQEILTSEKRRRNSGHHEKVAASPTLESSRDSASSV